MSIKPIIQKKSVGSPSYEYDSVVRQWKRCRAVLAGEQAVKAFDETIDRADFSNLLIPFSPTMTATQYKWFKAEAELPGLASQYLKVLLGGLLRKTPELELPEEPLGVERTVAAKDWLVNYITEENSSLVSLMTDILTEQLTSARGYISVDYPDVKENSDKIQPYPIVWKAEEVINIQTAIDPELGNERLTRIVFRYIERVEDGENRYHPKMVPTCAEHYLDEGGTYRVQKHRLANKESNLIDISEGNLAFSYNSTETGLMDESVKWIPDGDEITPKMNGQPLREIPAWPLSGSFKVGTPILLPLIDKEISLYNKLSRRNHLLYGASTYTPVVYTDMQDEEFSLIVEKGLGSWLRLGKEDRIEALTTPTEALSDLSRVIEQTLNEMAILGIRILNPEGEQAGISITIKNSIQIAQLGMINVQIGTIMKRVFATMLQWRYGEPFLPDDIKFELSADFDPSPTSSEWMRMVTEWYQSRIIPRSVWLSTAKRHDILPNDYDDEEGMTEIAEDPLTMGQSYNVDISEE